MTSAARGRSEERFLILTSKTKDAHLTQGILGRAGLECAYCRDIGELIHEMDQHAAAIMLPEEAVVHGGALQLQKWLENQPPWSDIPVLVFARAGADSNTVAEAMELLGNVTVLERPIRIASLVSTVRTALRARQRQYQIRDHLTAREEAARKLRADDQRKDEFLATLAHELRNPLAPIRNALELMNLTGDLDPVAEKLRALMERQVDHMVRLVDDLLEVSRITRGKIALKRELIDLSSIIDSAVETSRPGIDKHNHQLTVSLPAEEMTVFGDPMRLAQVFANLLNNSAKYTEDGGSIFLTARNIDPWFEVEVSDNGLGISAEMLPRVFDMFAQIERSKERSQGGLGIGLTLVKTLVELHSGEVDAQSEGVGYGARFVVRLPRSRFQPVASAQTVSEPNPSTGHRVLIVDDNRDAATTLGTLLEMFGPTVRLAFSGNEALEIARKFKPSIILLDLGMPVMSGHEVAKAIRGSSDFGEITLIALTGWGQTEDRRQTLAAGFDYHLVKPVDLKILEELLGSIPLKC